MRSKNKIYFNTKWLLYLVLFLISGCKKQLEIDAPSFSVNQETIYKTDAGAISVLSGIYTYVYESQFWRISYLTGLSADELTLNSSSTNIALQTYYKNTLTNSSVSIGNLPDFWNVIYPIVFYSNDAIEGLNKSNSLTPAIKKQLLGEAKFVRAFCYFYLVNLYGDVPLVLTTDYKLSAKLSRNSKQQVWDQIITDLKEAKDFLSDDFRDGTLVRTSTDRVRPTKWAAVALLARAYLYVKDYVNAEIEATHVIANQSLFRLAGLGEVFVKNNIEAIWQVQAVNPFGLNTQDARLFVIPPTGFNDESPVYLSDNLVNGFEPGDLRRSTWIKSISLSSKIYNYVYKFKVNEPLTPATEYPVIMRLAEQYLIRAEARVNQPSKIGLGIQDINIVRARARAPITALVQNPLPPLSESMDKVTALEKLEHERRTELFTEWGHRWLDLKRTDRINAVMSEAAKIKNTVWNANWQWYPIPLLELQRNPALGQNAGY